MIRILLFVFIIMIVVIFFSSFLSYKEKIMEKKVNKLNEVIYNKHLELQKLKAEWNYLNNRDYLRMLTKKYYPKLKQANLKQNTDIRKLERLEDKDQKNESPN